MAQVVNPVTEGILDELRREGGRVTSVRRAVVDGLVTAPDHHVTAENLAEAVQGRHPDVHLSTIYRTLEALERLGVVEHVHLGHGRAVYHLRDHPHHHLVCESCGAVVEVPNEVFADLEARVRRDYGFTAHLRHFAVLGRCRDCSGDP